MHMKHSHLLKIRRAAAILCAAVLLCACSNEIGIGKDEVGGKESELTTVTLSVGTAAGAHAFTTKGLSNAEENAIYDLYILAFQLDEAGAYRLKYYATGTPANDGSGQFSFSQIGRAHV